MLFGKLAFYGEQSVDGLYHVHGYADGARLVGDAAGNGLAYPPGGVGAEFIAAVVIELLHGPDEAYIALLQEVKQRHAVAKVLFGYAYHQAQVGLYQMLLCSGGFVLYFIKETLDLRLNRVEWT